MAKEKLFTPEDFDKPKDKTFWYKYKLWILGIAATLILALIVLFCIFYDRIDQKENVLENGQKAQIYEPTKDPSSSTEKTESIDEENNREIFEASDVDSDTIKAQTSVERDTQSALKTETLSDNVEQEAMNVIRGDYGNIPERREKLGPKYQEIQNVVNRLKREGKF